MPEIIKDKTLYDLVIYAFTHPQYYNMAYGKEPIFELENAYGGFRSKEDYAREGVYHYAEQLYKLYEKQIGKNEKDFPRINLSAKSIFSQ